MVHDTLHKDLQLSKNQPVDWPKWFAHRWRRSDSGQRNVYKDERRCFLTISDNVLNVVEKAGCEEWAGRPHPHPGGLQKELKGVRKMPRRRTTPMHSGGDNSTARTTLRSLLAIMIKAKNRKRPNFNGFSFIGSSGFEGNTPRKSRKKRSLSSS